MSSTRNCELLGVCQHPQRECTGACEATPVLPFWLADDEPRDEPKDLQHRWQSVAAAVSCAVVALAGLAGFVLLCIGAGAMWQWWQP